MNIKKIEPVTNSYGKSMDNPGKRDMSFDTTPKKSRDVLEISSEGQDAVNRSVGQKGYELSKVMNIHQKRANGEASEEEIEYYWRTRENDPALDMQLYEQDKAEAMEFVNNAQRILRKMGSCQKLTKEERDMVKNDLRLQKKIAKKPKNHWQALEKRQIWR